MSRLYRCKSGQHRWLEREKARKCCNTHELVLVEVPRGYNPPQGQHEDIVPIHIPGRTAEIAYGFKLIPRVA